MLDIRNIVVKYDKNVALDSITLNLEKGKLHGLAGLNGAGKTSLLNAIYGFVKPYSGEITWDGIEIKRKNISFLEAQHYFYPRLTGNDYIDLFSANNSSFDREKWMKMFRLPLAELISSYSSGMQKKLALMGNIALDKPLMLLDEPYNSLDLDSVELLQLLLPAFAAMGKTIIITSHIMETLTDTCNEIHYLENGKISASYSKEEFPGLKNLLRKNAHDKYENMIGEIFDNKRNKQTPDK